MCVNHCERKVGVQALWHMHTVPLAVIVCLEERLNDARYGKCCAIDCMYKLSLVLLIEVADVHASTLVACTVRGATDFTIAFQTWNPYLNIVLAEGCRSQFFSGHVKHPVWQSKLLNQLGLDGDHLI